MCVVASVEPLVLSNITVSLWRSDVDGDSDNQPTGLMADLLEGRIDVVGGGFAGRYSRYR